jgi:hypothetical protein
VPIPPQVVVRGVLPDPNRCLGEWRTVGSPYGGGITTRRRSLAHARRAQIGPWQIIGSGANLVRAGLYDFLRCN